MSSPTVAIGIPVFNGERWLRKTTESILGQTYADLEVVICDNASTDGTADICASLRAEDRRVRYLRNTENIGIFRNYDLAFHRTNSPYFKWCAVGDLCDSTFIAKAVRILDENPDVVIAHSRTRLIGDVPGDPERYLAELNLVDEDPAVRFREYLSRVRLNNVMNGLMRSAELRRTSLNRVFHASDKCMIAEMALRGKIVEIPEELFHRRMEQETATTLHSAEEAKKFFATEPVSPATLYHWKTELTLMAAPWKAPIGLSRKLALTAYAAKRLVWQRRELVEDLARFMRIGT